MHVMFVTVSGHQSGTFNPAIEIVEMLESTASLRRIAFGGMTGKGRGGVALDLFNMKVVGHKLEPIPERLEDLVEHIALIDARKGLRLFASGKDVLIGTPEHGVLLKWSGPGFEAFGSGADSYH